MKVKHIDRTGPTPVITEYDLGEPLPKTSRPPDPVQVVYGVPFRESIPVVLAAFTAGVVGGAGLTIIILQAAGVLH